MKALVIGGTGFIGSHVVDALLASGHKVRIFDRSAERSRAALESVEYVQADFQDALALAEALTGVDTVFHLLSTSVPSLSNADPLADIRGNLEGSVQLLEQMRKQQVERILFLSSGGTVYGQPREVPVPETHPLQPVCSYGVVKVAIEHYLQMYRDLYGLSPVVLRVSNPYGPRQGHVGVQGVVATILQRLLKGETLDIWGDGSVVRDFLYIDDLVCLCLRAAESDQCGIFNAGSGEGKNILQVVTDLAALLELEPDIRFQPKRSFDVQRIVLDITRARESFAWQPQTSWTSGLEKLLAGIQS